ncbi:hypothetical protein [Tranquillimonas alkanivorans]|uniref:hypothetical protein n=1 Tax=Tranquillimonas alkanivorans TaxID=441119 RepID=UPI001160C897|nr:hypothetical protein [Tranquillimonas alkanivorans]
MDYLGSSPRTDSFDRAQVQKVLDDLDLLNQEIVNSLDADDFSRRIEAFRDAQPVHSDNIHTALAISQFESLRSYCLIEVRAASTLISNPRELPEYFFGTSLKNAGNSELLLFMALFPASTDRDSETLGISGETRKALLTHLIDRLRNEKAFMGLAKAFADAHPHFHLYPAILRWTQWERRDAEAST